MHRIMTEKIIVALAVTAVLGGMPAIAVDTASKQAATAPAKTASVTQASYASPETAARALYEAVAAHNLKRISEVLGPGSDKLLYTGDAVADQQMQHRFLAAYDKVIKIEREGSAKAMLSVGEQEYPFPFPLVKDARGWKFDSRTGLEEIVNRRIGENELFAIKFCLAYGDAQREYAEADRDGDGLIEYAQKFRSSEGKRDGLYWHAKEGEALSPLGPLAARAKSEGYSAKDGGPVPYHGYYYRILTRQGKDASGGDYDYLVNGNMIGGYALVAYPARWGASGVMTFICNHDGKVYQKNLGEASTDIASKMSQYNPDPSWSKAE